MTAHPTAPRSRRERPAKPALTREGIIATTVDLMRAEGLERVTMRRLAKELDTGPASLYVYVRNMAELHAAVLDELLGAVDLSPAKADGEWRDRLVRILTSYTSVLFEYPGLAQSALVARPFGKHYLKLVEALLALLDEGGLEPDRAAWLVDLLLQFATATAAEHAHRAPGDTTQSEADWQALATVVRDVSPRTHPHIAALGPRLLSGSPQDRLAWGFDVLIAGARHAPLPEVLAPSPADTEATGSAGSAQATGSTGTTGS
ncbi:TetR/AcrR family transcriptional regulator [Streptomyces sp. DASNCL29]|uniref:TetR/AcrR family transcriptional regulator n=1 Tax=Streptomyces sp. DASNCL29 TaxID=2583819 RepID=UPI00110F78F3|nr:TetR/AcrR family transcriptional regulator [Streptomyces sp. DASNCL29]TMU90278.1 TetR/AcrR family transcriptional regulator [Streptomyces sp. DASNCL29]